MFESWSDVAVRAVVLCLVVCDVRMGGSTSRTFICSSVVCTWLWSPRFILGFVDVLSENVAVVSMLHLNQASNQPPATHWLTYEL